MDTLKGKAKLFGLLFIAGISMLQSQNQVEDVVKVSEEERQFINELTVQANQLIWHVNINIKSLSKFQEKVNEWYVSNEGIHDAPDFFFISNSNNIDIKTLIAGSTINANNKLFNYKTNLLRLTQETELFNSLCKQLQAIPKVGSKASYYAAVQKVFYQIQSMSNVFVDISYDFSLSCAINYGREKMPVELDRMKNMVGQAKNLIMAIRLNEPKQAKAYLNQLNLSIVQSSTDSDFSNFVRVGKFAINNQAAANFHTELLEAANTIAYWGEQYIQSNLEAEEVSFILENAVNQFNQFEKSNGCAGSYNKLVETSKIHFLHFTEEPLFFDVKIVEKPVVQNITPKPQDTLKTPTVTKPEVVKVETSEKPKPVFDEKNINTLDGALPNNIIIMMDVSASMKTTGKLPLLKSSINHLLSIMRPQDRISLIAYSGEANLLIGNAGINNRNEIKTVLDTLHSSGGTDIENGVKLGYETALKSFMKNGNNRIIIVTDGQFGVRTQLLKLVQEKSLTGVVLSVFQFNDDKYETRNSNLQLLANTGRGSYRTISNSEDALQQLMQEVKKKGI